MKILLNSAKTIDLTAPASNRLPAGQPWAERWIAGHPDTIRGTKALTAAAAYMGAVGKALNFASFTAEEQAWADGHLLILSALYGPLRPLDCILPYRLDFVLGKQALKKAWGSAYADLTAAHLAPDEEVLDLASAEFTALLAPLWQTRRHVRIRFAACKKGALTTHATTSKKGRGDLARSALIHRCTSLNQVADLETSLGFRCHSKTNDELLFVTNDL